MASVTNLTITINNNFTINKDCGNTTINNNTKIIKEKTLFEKCNDFAKYIKNDKPKWYIPGEFIPKQLLTDMFNDFADVEKNVKQMNSLFKEKLFYEEKRLTKNYAGEKRRFRCIKCLSYENL